MRQSEVARVAAKAAHLVHEEGQGLERGDFEGLSAADVGARQLVVASYHVRLSLGEAGTITLIRVARKLAFFAADDPGDFIIGGLSAFGAGEGVGSLLGRFVEEVPFFHLESFASNSLLEERFRESLRLFRSGGIYSILNLTMAKRKQEQFSATKAVKANARERVGQPKPTRVVEDKTKAGRKTKHKEKLEDILRRDE